MDRDWTNKTETFPWGLSTAKSAQRNGAIGYFTNITEKKNKLKQITSNILFIKSWKK